MLRVYIKEVGRENASVSGYLLWQKCHANANMRLLGNTILYYPLAIYIFKIGVRYNDVELIDAAKHTFNDLFYTFNHPIY